MTGQAQLTVEQEMAHLRQLISQQAHQANQLQATIASLRGDLAAVQGQQAVQRPRFHEPTFAAAKIKLDLPPKFAGKPKDLNGWLFSVEQYCGMVGILKPVDMVKLGVSRLEGDAFTWWRQLTARGEDYHIGALGWADFKSELVNAFVDVDRELKLRRQLASLRQQTSVTDYTKKFRQLILELGDQAPDDAALLFMFTEGLKADVQLQVLLARPQFLSEAEQVAERADVALFSSGRRGQGNQGQYQQRQKQPQWQQRQQQQYRYQKPPPPPPRNGPVPMDLGTMQYQPQQQSQGAGTKRSVVCYRCGKSGHMAKDCRVNLGKQKQQVRKQGNFNWVQPPTYIPVPQYMAPTPSQAPTYAHVQALPQQPMAQQPIGQQPVYFAVQAPPPPPPLNCQGDRC